MRHVLDIAVCCIFYPVLATCFLASLPRVFTNDHTPWHTYLAAGEVHCPCRPLHNSVDIPLAHYPLIDFSRVCGSGGPVPALSLTDGEEGSRIQAKRKGRPVKDGLFFHLAILGTPQGLILPSGVPAGWLKSTSVSQAPCGEHKIVSAVS